MTIFAAFTLVTSVSADQITKKDGTVVSGTITGVSGQGNDKQVTIQQGTATFPIYLADIKSVAMAPPAAVTQLKSAPPATVIATLEPLIKQYAGLPTDWVTDAMAQLGDAYDTSGQADKATAVYNQINQLYPNSPYQMLAVTGTARQLLQQGKPDQALAAVAPLITKANQNLAPSPAEGRLYASAFLVEGQALEAQKKLPEALEAYLTVVTMFYQNSALVDQANQLVKNLRAQNPTVSVN